VDKPAGMPSVPARTASDPPCVAARLHAAYGPLEAVHRLDRDTSGVLVLARTATARAALGRAFEMRLVRKRYETVVHGRPAAVEGVIHLPLAPDPLRPPRSRVDPILGRPASTRWRLLVTPSLQPGWSSLELEPITGRSHQLRVHLAWLGLPIVGDRLYGPSPAGAAPRSVSRLFLHASRLEFPHPRHGRPAAYATDAPWKNPPQRPEPPAWPA